MVSWNLGSCAAELHNMIPNIPTSLSGASLLSVIDRVRLKIENYTGQTVGSVGIDENYQSALTNLSVAKTLVLVHLQGGDTSIGDVSLGRSAMDGAGSFESQGMAELRRLGMKTTLYKTFG